MSFSAADKVNRWRSDWISKENVNELEMARFRLGFVHLDTEFNAIGKDMARNNVRSVKIGLRIPNTKYELTSAGMI